MKEKQRSYSLTAKERKAKRLGDNKTQIDKNDDGAVLRAEETAMLQSQTKSKHSAALIGAIVAAAIVLILCGLIIPVCAHVANPYRGYDDVIARFKLSNGMELEYVIDEEQYDIAATNFIFLAKNGYFDNTVFFDAQEGWLRFGGYEAQPRQSSSSSNDYNLTHHRSLNEEYCTNFKALPTDQFDKPINKFGYKLRADSAGENKAVLEDIGILTYLYSDTNTEFQFSYRKQATDNITRISVDGSKSSGSLKSTMVGRALNDETIANLGEIAKLGAVNTSITYGYLWSPPTPDIRIKSVKVYNLDKSKWKHFDFIEYMNGNDSSGRKRLAGWTGKV